MDEPPRYVLEYPIDIYCSKETFVEDFERVKHRLRENFVHDDADLRSAQPPDE